MQRERQPPRKAVRLGRIAASFVLGTVAGLVLGSWLLQRIEEGQPWLAPAAALCGVAISVGLFMWHEERRPPP